MTFGLAISGDILPHLNGASNKLTFVKAAKTPVLTSGRSVLPHIFLSLPPPHPRGELEGGKEGGF